MLSKRQKEMRRRLLDLIRNNPGLDAKQLRVLGFRVLSHGSLWEAEQAGEIEWSGSGWYIKGQVPECPLF